MKKVLVKKAGLDFGGIIDAIQNLIDAIIGAITDFLCAIGLDTGVNCS